MGRGARNRPACAFLRMPQARNPRFVSMERAGRRKGVNGAEESFPLVNPLDTCRSP